MTHSCSFCRSRQSSPLRRLIRAYSPPKPRELRDIRDRRTVADQAKAIADRYDHERAVRFERWLGVTYVTPERRTA